MPGPIETLPTREMSQDNAIAIAKLLVGVWPKVGITVADRAEILRTNRGDADASDPVASRSIVVRDGQRVVGHAVVFPRTIGTTAGDMTIAGLGSVCTASDFRGHGIGEALVKEAFRPVDEGLLPFALFQTSNQVSKFYLRMGCAFVENPIVDSTANEPTANPFKDHHVMRYPANREPWPEGQIDLRGPGY